MRTTDTRWPTDAGRRTVYRASADLLYFADAVRGLLRLERFYTAPERSAGEDAEHRDMVRFDAPAYDLPDGFGYQIRSGR